MDNDWEYQEFCTCGHAKEKHLEHQRYVNQYCVECWNSATIYTFFGCMHKFKLDNLKLVEDMAKQKRLI